MLVPSDGSPDDRFGAGTAISGSTLFVGSREHVVNGIRTGAVYVVQYDGSQWQQVDKLVPSDPSNLKHFGTAIAVDGDVLAIGCGRNPGAVYMFEFNGEMWGEQQRIVPSDIVSFDLFGASLALDGDDLLVGAPGNDAGLIDAAGAVYVYRFDGLQWVLQQKLRSPTITAFESFGESVARAGTTVVIGAPGSTSPISTFPGFAYVFTRSEAMWNHTQTIAGSSGVGAGRFGASATMDDQRVFIGAPGDRVPENQSLDRTGSIYVFESIRGTWSETERFIPRHPNRVRQTGVEISVCGSEVFAAAISWTQFPFVDYAGDWVVCFQHPPGDCDFDGVPDQCETDCNANQIADGCELANVSEPAPDCNENNTPDECEANLTYQLDQAAANMMWGYMQPWDFLWLNQFTVQHGGEFVTHVSLPWSPWVPPFTPVTVAVYDDPNNDGDPSDAVVLGAAQSAMLNDDFSASGPSPMAIIRIPTTNVGRPGDSFFVGAFLRAHQEYYFATSDWTGPNLGRSWFISGEFGTVDPLQPSTGGPPSVHTRNWWLRALSLDCNGNGAWDQCDIDSGWSVDLNANGIPDECDAPCDGDVAGGPVEFAPDGQVAIDDLLVVIGHWDATGPPGGPGDVAPPGGDGVVNIDDLLEIVGAWGPCP